MSAVRTGLVPCSWTHWLPTWEIFAASLLRKLVGDLHLHCITLQHARGGTTASWPGLSSMVSLGNIWVSDLLCNMNIKCYCWLLGKSGTTRQVMEGSTVLGGGTHWQPTINQCRPSEAWTLFQVSWDQLTPLFHQTNLFGCKVSLKISLNWTSNTTIEAFLIDVHG